MDNKIETTDRFEKRKIKKGETMGSKSEARKRKGGGKGGGSGGGKGASESVTDLIYRHKATLETVFHIMDRDSSGTVTKEEFKTACKLLFTPGTGVREKERKKRENERGSEREREREREP